MAKYDFVHPMHGIFHEARKRNFPIKQYVILRNSSRCTDTTWKPVDIVIEESSDLYGWASENYQNSYVEFSFLVYQMKIEGYSLSYPAGDDKIIHNWEFRCFFGEQNFQIDSHTNDHILGPNKAPFTICRYNDQKYFQFSKVYNCNSIRLTQTGPNNSGRNYLDLLGFEVFDQLAVPYCKTFQYNFNCMNFDFYLFYVNIAILI